MSLVYQTSQISPNASFVVSTSMFLTLDIPQYMYYTACTQCHVLPFYFKPWVHDLNATLISCRNSVNSIFLPKVLFKLWHACAVRVMVVSCVSVCLLSPFCPLALLAHFCERYQWLQCRKLCKTKKAVFSKAAPFKSLKRYKCTARLAIKDKRPLKVFNPFRRPNLQDV